MSTPHRIVVTHPWESRKSQRLFEIGIKGMARISR